MKLFKAIYLTKLGKKMLAEKNYQKAIEVLKETTKFNYRLPYNYDNLGIAFAHLDPPNMTEAIKAFKKALELKPGYFLYYRRLIHAFIETGDYESALEYCKTSLDRKELADFQKDIIKDKMAEILSSDELRRYDEAIDILADLKRREHNVDLNLSTVYIKKGDLEKAKELLTRTLDRKKDDVNSMLNLATIHKIEGNFSEAMKLNKKVLSLDPNNYYANVYLAWLYDKLGDKVQAQRYHSRASDLKREKISFLEQSLTDRI